MSWRWKMFIVGSLSPFGIIAAIVMINVLGGKVSLSLVFFPFVIGLMDSEFLPPQLAYTWALMLVNANMAMYGYGGWLSGFLVEKLYTVIDVQDRWVAILLNIIFFSMIAAIVVWGVMNTLLAR